MQVKKVKPPFVVLLLVFLLTSFGVVTSAASTEEDLPECCKTAPMQCSETELLKCNILNSCKVAEEVPQGCENLDIWSAPQEHKDMSLYQFKTPVLFLDVNDLSIFGYRAIHQNHPYYNRYLKQVTTFVCPYKASYFLDPSRPNKKNSWIYFCAADETGNPSNWTTGIPISNDLVVGGQPPEPRTIRNYNFLIHPNSDSAIVKNVSPIRHFPSSSIQLHESRLAYCRSEKLRRKLECDVNKLRANITALESRLKAVEDESKQLDQTEVLSGAEGRLNTTGNDTQLEE